MRFHKVVSGALALLLLCALPALAGAKERSVTVSVDIDLPAPSGAKEVKLWLPDPMSDRNQDVTNVRIAGN